MLTAGTNIDVGVDLLIIPLLTFRQVSLWSHTHVLLEKYIAHEIIVFTESENAQVCVCVPNIHNRLGNLLDCHWNIHPLSPTTPIPYLSCASEMQTPSVTSGALLVNCGIYFPCTKYTAELQVFIEDKI